MRMERPACMAGHVLTRTAVPRGHTVHAVSACGEAAITADRR